MDDFEGSEMNLLVLVELVVGFLRCDVQFMLCLGLRRLERAGQDA
jgi:hypothetical protein